MADMPNDFWSGWIIVLTVLSFAGLGWLVLSVYFLPQEKVNEEDEPVWDGDIREGNSPAPMWWFWLLLSMMVFSVAYLMLYPGLGSFKGAFRWSQGGELQQNMQGFENEYAEVKIEILQSSIEELQARPDIMQSAKTLFNINCSACHGYEAQGQASLFPNLMDDDWQWGGSPEQIELTIRNGRLAGMISWQAVLNDEGVANVSDYVLNVLGEDNTDNDTTEHPGMVQYNQFCIACHGAAGQGNPLFGAPNLSDDIWLYGGEVETVRQSISLGRTGQMPAFNSRLDETQIKMLVAWLAKDD